MKSRFDLCLERVLGHEGGYVNDRNDRGGATNAGVTQKTYDDWRVSKGLGRQQVSGIHGDEIRQIYLARYWLLGKCDHLPVPLDYVHFDSCVNHGVGQAAKFLQRALGVPADGAIGPQTIAAIKEDERAGTIDDVCRDILKQRDSFYARLAESDPKQNAFIVGWRNRINRIRKQVLL